MDLSVEIEISICWLDSFRFGIFVGISLVFVVIVEINDVLVIVEYFVEEG